MVVDNAVAADLIYYLRQFVVDAGVVEEFGWCAMMNDVDVEDEIAADLVGVEIDWNLEYIFNKV